MCIFDICSYLRITDSIFIKLASNLKSVYLNWSLFTIVSLTSFSKKKTGKGVFDINMFFVILFRRLVISHIYAPKSLIYSFSFLSLSI